jgi:predicted nucleic acid-binding protein
VVAARSPTEPGYADSAQLLARFASGRAAVVDPTLVVTEIAAAVARKSGDAQLAQSIARAFGTAPHVTLIAVDAAVAFAAAAVAALHGPRASDALYVAIALRFGSALVTLDRRQHAHATGLVQTLWPAEALVLLR